MRPLIIAVAALLVCAVRAPTARAGRPCDDLASCLAALPKTATADSGISPEEQALSDAIQRYGRAAVPGLLRFLASNDRGVRKLAANTLRDLDGLTEAEVPPLLRALSAGEQWVAPALGRIGSRAAIDGLYQELQLNPETHTQVTWAFKKAGARAVPTLLGAFDCRAPCNEALLTAVAFAFKEIGPDAAGGVAKLVKVATDEGRPVAARRAAIAALGGIGPGAAESVPALQRLRAAAPATFGDVVQQAFEAMKVPAAVDALVADLAGEETDRALEDLAALGAAGRAAGPSVVKLLAHKDWTMRVLAARALGYIEFPEAVRPLVGALGNVENWQLAFAAAGSLGRLKNPAALPALRAVELRHWYPPVREAARKAQAVIDGRERYVSRWHPDNFSLEFSDYEHAGSDLPGCEVKGALGFEPDADLRRARARSMTYDARVVGYGAGPGGRPERHEKPVKQKPSAALEVDGVWLLGGNRGEWGGELVAVDREGRQALILDGNIQAIARLGARIVALGGLAHMLSNSGTAYEIVRDATGTWSARPWRVLPGEPEGSALQPDGRWLIRTNGGIVVLSPDGRLAMARCARQAK